VQLKGLVTGNGTRPLTLKVSRKSAESVHGRPRTRANDGERCPSARVPADGCVSGELGPSVPRLISRS
jgi:hypothetical protein